MPKPQDRVWIALEQADTEEEAQRICAKANRMLERLNGAPVTRAFDYTVPRAGMISYTYGDAMGHHELLDRGVWFSLDHLGRE